MNSVEHNFCKDYTQKLIDCELTIAFVNPVDKNADYAQDYFRIIENPMDLSTVLTKLKNKQYQTVEEWHTDINLIWKNAMTFNKKPSLLFYVADFLQKKCDKGLVRIPHTEQETLYIQLDSIDKKLAKLLSFDVPVYSSVPRVSQDLLQVDVG